MGLLLQIVGGVLAAVGFVLMLIVVHGVTADSSPALLLEFRQWWDRFLFIPATDFDARLKQGLGFIVFVGPGIALFYFGKDLAKKKAR
jgi:hypothetical protein